jgi:hypothetical protein
MNNSLFIKYFVIGVCELFGVIELVHLKILKDRPES